MVFALLALICLLFASCHSGGSASWGYDEIDANTSHWVKLYEECDSSRQSPIDIITNDNTSTCSTPLTLDWVSQKIHFVLRNNGHSLKAIPFIIDHEGLADISELEVLHHTNDTNIRLTNSFYNTFKSPVHEEYCFDSFHFHWGLNNERGSEHALNGKHYPLEIHLVHYSCDYYTIGEALSDYYEGTVFEKHDDGNVLAVIGVLFEIGEANEALQKILDEVIAHDIHKYHDPTDTSHIDNILELYYTEFDMMGLLPSNKEIVAYLGSLTTPPCFETVRWHILKDTMTVSEEQMAIFRTMLESTHSNDSMAPNWRPLQDIGDRTLYRCQETIIAQNVEKDEKDEELETVNLDEADVIIITDDTWYIIGVTFICLFVVSLLVIGYLIMRLSGRTGKIGNSQKTNQRTATYQPTPSVDPDAAQSTNKYH